MELYLVFNIVAGGHSERVQEESCGDKVRERQWSDSFVIHSGDTD